MMAQAESKIEIGQHVQRHLGGWTFNMDTIWTSVVAGLIVCGLGLWARAKLTASSTDRVPTKIQLVWEVIVDAVQKQVEDSLGRVNPFVVPLAVALFFFILISNWLEVLPTQPNNIHLLPSPTADTNLTYALAVLVIIGVWAYGIREKGLAGYLKHFLEPFPWLLPLNIIEELIKPVTLALRLFGNIFAGGIMLSLIGLIPFYANWPFQVIWKLFDTMFLGFIQAFIFALLTVLYFGMAGAGHGDDHDVANERDLARDDDERPADAISTSPDTTSTPAQEPVAAH
jgi:F-type H+-transporting ATPase subunit a